MDIPVLILTVSFVILLLMNVPIAISIGISTFLTIVYVMGSINGASEIIAQRMATGIDSFALLAIPFFVLAGLFMGRGGIARRLIDFANTLVGQFTGGLAYVNILTCMLFGALSGSSVAAVSAVGGFMIPEMNRKGYDRDFNVAVSTTAATTGLMIPPSNIMIVYALVAGGGVSIVAMFMAGILPGILFGLLLMLAASIVIGIKKFGIKRYILSELFFTISLVVSEVFAILVAYTILFLTKKMVLPSVVLLGLCLILEEAYAIKKSRYAHLLLIKVITLVVMSKVNVLSGILTGFCLMMPVAIISKKKNYSAGDIDGLIQIFKEFKSSVLSLLLIVIVLGGIIGGIFTATEAAAIAVVYAFILAVFVYREVKIKEIPEILLQCGITTAVVMLLIATSSAMSWIMATQNIPQNVSAALLSISNNKIVILLIINILLLFVGTFMDMTPAVLIFTPIFLPVVVKLGIHPVHFGLIIIANLCIGLCTPPVGTCLFVGCGVGKTTIVNVTRPLLPFFAAMVVALMIVTYIPQISLFIPELLKLINI